MYKGSVFINSSWWPRVNHRQLELGVLSEGGLLCQATNAFSSAGNPLEFEEADQRIRGFVLLIQKHLLCMKASRKCLLTSCYFCVTVTFRGWVCVKRSFPWFLLGGTGPWVSFISEAFKVLWRHLPIFVTSRWIFSINQSPRICFTQSFWLEFLSRSAKPCLPQECCTSHNSHELWCPHAGCQA